MHSRWCIQDLVRLAHKLNIIIPFDSYYLFFELLYKDCIPMENTLISWTCTPNKKTVCESVKSNFNKILQNLEASDENITVPFTYFAKEVQYDDNGNVLLRKNEKAVKRLVPKIVRGSGKFLVEFLRNVLPSFVHHRNMIKLYRNLKHNFIDNMHAI